MDFKKAPPPSLTKLTEGISISGKGLPHALTELTKDLSFSFIARVRLPESYTHPPQEVRPSQQMRRFGSPASHFLLPKKFLHFAGVRTKRTGRFPDPATKDCMGGSVSRRHAGQLLLPGFQIDQAEFPHVTKTKPNR